MAYQIARLNDIEGYICCLKPL